MTLVSRPPVVRMPSIRLVSLSAAILFATALLALTAGPARALVVPLGGPQYGVQPHATVLEQFSANPLGVLQYGGGPVLAENDTYAIYWDPATLRPGDPGRPGKYHGNWQQLINGFLADVAAGSGSFSNVFAFTAQYPEANGTRPAYNSTFAGAAVDRDTYPTDGCTDPDHALNRNFACLTDAQLREELVAFIAANGLHAGPHTIFFLLTPPGVTVCLDGGGAASGHCSDSTMKEPWSTTPPEPSEQASYARSFCSYHADATTTSSETLLYAVIPWVAGTYGAGPEMLPKERDGSDCQDGTGVMQEPNQAGLALDGFYDQGLPDVIINQVAAEQFATITDPQFNGWTEPGTGDEAPDMCRDWFELPPVVQGSGTPNEHTGAGSYFNQTINGHNYYLNTEYNQAAQYYDYPGLRCELYNNLVPSFTAPQRVASGDVVGFDGTESDVTLEQSADATPASQPQYRAIFSWNFGDGSAVVSGPGYSGPNASTPLDASVFHAYRYGGTYEVRLTITDAGGNSASVTEPITVVGPPPPPPGEGEGAGAGSSTAHAGAVPAGAPGGTGGGSAPIPGPEVRATATSRSLAQVLRHGLTVSYTVNEQVAGHFEVLLDKRTAKRLKVGGPTATGLPAGSAPSLVIGRALLVTTKGGHAQLHIKFTKGTDARLRNVRRLKLMLRLVVRNAATQSPQTTTLLSTVELHH